MSACVRRVTAGSLKGQDPFSFCQFICIRFTILFFSDFDLSKIICLSLTEIKDKERTTHRREPAPSLQRTEPVGRGAAGRCGPWSQQTLVRIPAPLLTSLTCWGNTQSKIGTPLSSVSRLCLGDEVTCVQRSAQGPAQCR